VPADEPAGARFALSARVTVTAIEKLQREGIRRIGSPRSGFRYRRAGGGRVSSGDRERIRKLRIPPAWRDAAIASSERTALQAAGRDKAGRWQYLYHPRAVERRAARKYRRLVQFAEALPRMRRAVAQDLARPGLPREKVLACILRVLSSCFLRPGSEAYAAENGSFGVATLRRRHVSVRGDTVTFDFPGKSGKRQTRQLRDRKVARILRQLLALKGREVFQFVDEDGNAVDVRRRHINQYVKEVMGERFSAKDFRTWAGTLICACALARARPGNGESGEPRGQRRRVIVAAIREAAEHLGNTVAVCRASYIYPSVLRGFEKGRVIDRYFKTLEELVERRSPELHASEKALLKLLRKEAA
jgi:DNA topoisomerase-1